MDNEDKKPYQTPALILYGEISKISAAGSNGDPEGNTDAGPLSTDEEVFFG